MSSQNIDAQRKGYYELQEELRIKGEAAQAQAEEAEKAKQAELEAEVNSLTFTEDDLVPIVGNPKIGENYYFKLKDDDNIYYGRMSQQVFGGYGFETSYGKDKQLIQTFAAVSPKNIYKPKNKPSTGGKNKKNRTKHRKNKNRTRKTRTRTRRGTKKRRNKYSRK